MFILIVFLMSISLVGIILVQVYWIQNAIESKNKQFKNDVQHALARTSEIIQEKELDQIDQEIQPFLRSNVFRTGAEIKDFVYQQIDTSSKRKLSFGTRYLEEGFKIPLDIFNDTLFVKKITGKKKTVITNYIKSEDGLGTFINEEKFSSLKRISSYERNQYLDFFNDFKKKAPIHKRISNRELNNVLKEEFRKRNIKINFKYGVYDNGLATSLKSGYFRIDNKNGFPPYPLFKDSEGNSDYKLYITFPDEKQHLLSGISNILLLSTFFIFIIIVAFSSSLYQLIRQKKISEIKTDFINNMTHEFKTPIATINLALDAIKNPKIINDEVKVRRYINMIREENKRMHGQVENVLRISRLEKNQIDISKDAVDVNDIIEEAVEHVDLLVKDKNGTITLHFKAISTEVLGNHFHLVNVVVNILENAMKYSEDAPKINVYTESTNKYFIFKIEDEGIGMSKQAQKYVFDKFYREHKGNIHNVKGHGLGLAYVKEIVESHHGTVFVESEKGKGSLFTVKLPLI